MKDTKQSDSGFLDKYSYLPAEVIEDVEESRPDYESLLEEKLSLEEVYFLIYDGPARDEHLAEAGLETSDDSDDSDDSEES
jgi:hypothetical protein